MTHQDKVYCILALAIALLPHLIVGAMDQGVNESLPPVAAVMVDKPAAPAKPEAYENVDEAQLIELALLAQGYYREDVPLSYDEQDTLHTACEANGVPYALALGLIEVESGFKADAVSGSGCYGLCQLNTKYFPDDLSPEENITAGMKYLGELLKQYDDAAAALTAYNAGYDTGRRGYATAVLAAAEKWR